MGAGSGIALKGLQWFLRGVQFCCAAIVLAIFSYFLATLHNHGLGIPAWVRSVEGISGVATLYTLVALLFLWCLGGHPAWSVTTMVLDVAFASSFIYVASANRGGAGSCNGIVDTPFGRAEADTNVVDDGHGGFTVLPSFRAACRLETACMSVSIIAIFFFIFSITAEYALIRHQRKERRYGAALASTYSSGSGGAPADAFGGGDGVVDGGIPHKSSRFGGLFFWRRRGTGRIVRPQYQDPNALPAHTTPDQIRDSYATEETRVGSSASAAAGGVGVYGKYGYQQPLASSSSEQLEMNTYGPPIDNPALRPAGTPLNGDWYAGTSPNSNRYAGTNPYAGRPPPRHYSDGVYDV